MSDMFTFRDTLEPGLESRPRRGHRAEGDLSGFHVEATDGHIGHVDAATFDVGESYIVVDTGPWIFSKKVVLPAGVVDRVDAEHKRVYVHRTKDEIKNAPEFDEAHARDPSYREQLGSYYSSLK